MPALAYDRNDPDQVAFVQEATRYYQVYDAEQRTPAGAVCRRSSPLGLHYTPGEVRAFVEHPAVSDVQTDQRRIRFSNSVISPAPGETYLVQVGVPLDGRDAALRRSPELFSIWSLPVGLVAVLGVGRWMAGRALAPLARLAAAARTIGVDRSAPPAAGAGCRRRARRGGQRVQRRCRTPGTRGWRDEAVQRGDGARDPHAARGDPGGDGAVVDGAALRRGAPAGGCQSARGSR